MKTGKKRKKALPIVVSVLALILIAEICGLIWFSTSYVIVGGKAYPKNATYLDLSSVTLSIDQYNELAALLPDCEIDWAVPFQGKRLSNHLQVLEIDSITEEEAALLKLFPELTRIEVDGSQDYHQLLKLQSAYPDVLVAYTVPINGMEYSQDTTQITVSKLTDAEVNLLDGLPLLTEVNAEGCTDYAQLISLQQRRPEVDVRYTVTICGNDYRENTVKLALDMPAIDEVSEQLGNLPHLEEVDLTEPEGQASALLHMVEAYPNIRFTWKKTILGHTFSSEDTEFDFSGMDVTTDEVEAGMEFFPNAEKVIMSDCGIDNETMASFREKMRPNYKVVWTVIVTGQRVRTDDTIFHSSGRHVVLIDERSNDLFYCEDMIVVDIGHSHVKYIEWVKGMPNLKYLILADNWIMDISPISSCKKLVYLELFINKHLKDISPLVECTALEDVSVANTHVDLAPFAQMPWLKNLWVNNCGATTAERQLLTESLPDTHIEFDHGFTTGGGWRKLQNYYDMRALMGLPCNAW